MLLSVLILEDTEHSAILTVQGLHNVCMCMCGYILEEEILAISLSLIFHFKNLNAFCVSEVLIICAGSFQTKHSIYLDKSLMVKSGLSVVKRCSQGFWVQYFLLCILYNTGFESHLCAKPFQLPLQPKITFFFVFFFTSILSFEISSIVFSCHYYAAFAPFFFFF